MAYDEHTADRIRTVLKGKTPFNEKKMFGGIAFMVRGHMTIGIANENLMVRVGKDAHEEAVSQPHARPMDFTGKPMKGYIYVDPGGYPTDPDLASWIDRALAFNATMEEK